jgi:nucleotide-binding universal stress UspA family protein
MKHIIAATDFSDNANNAASFAADLACRLRAHLNLLYVFPTAVPFADGSMPPLYIEDAQEEGERQLAELKERLLLQTGEKIIVHTEVQGGSFMNELNDYCQKIVPYAVVVGTESESTIGRLAFGGEAVSALKHLSWPLIIVPPICDLQILNV